MKLPIELFVSAAGWTLPPGFTASVNQVPDFVADGLGASIVFYIPPGSSGKVISKSVAIDATGYPEAVLSLWSRNLSGSDFGTPDKYPYAFSLSGTAFTYLPVWPGFQDISFALPAAAVTQVAIKVLTDQEDWIIVSGLYAILDEYPLDVLTGIQSGLQAQAARLYPAGIDTGATVTAQAGDASVKLSGVPSFVDRYALLSFGGETHLVDEYDEATGIATFFSSWGGKAVLGAQAAVPVALQFPVQIVEPTAEIDYAIPGIAFGAMAPEPILRRGNVSKVYDSLREDGSFREVMDPAILRYTILIDVEARHAELMARMNRVVREFLLSGGVWINARRHNFVFEEIPIEIEPEDPTQMIAKTQWTLKLEVRESFGASQVVPGAGAGSITMHQAKPGVQI